MNLAWAVRISGDGGQEGRHLAPKKKKKGSGTRQRGHSKWEQQHRGQYLEVGGHHVGGRLGVRPALERAEGAGAGHGDGGGKRASGHRGRRFVQGFA